MCGSRLALQKKLSRLVKNIFKMIPSNPHSWSAELPCGEHLATIGAWIAEVFNALVDDLDVTVKVAFLAEYLIALGTRGRLVDLDV